MNVIVADSCAPPIDKPCGEGLMPDSLEALAQLGVRVPEEEGFTFRGIRFVSSETSVEAMFPVGSALGVRRTVLHSKMVERAAAAGVRFAWKSVATAVDRGGATIDGKRVSARWIIGADGSGSRVRKWAGLERHLKLDQRFAYRRHYAVRPWREFMELHWGPGCQLYVTPIGSKEVCVVLMSRDSSLRMDGALPAFPELERRLKGAQVSSAERGAVTMTRRLARVCSENIALIGDASGGVDAITGEGLCLTFRQAAALAEGLKNGSLAGYQSAHRRLATLPGTMAGLMLLLEGREGLRRRVMHAFVRQPRIFRGMLATHVGESSRWAMAANGLALGWGLLTA
jgi:flavin-dependent dehydrogenase